MADNTTLGLVVGAVTMIIAVLVFASIYAAMDNTSVSSENATASSSDSSNSSGYGAYTLSYTPVVTGSEYVWNGTRALTENAGDNGYTLDDRSGALNITDPDSLANIHVNYTYGWLTTQAAATAATINTTAYAAFALIVISLIIIAAALILRYTGMLGGGRG